jgi:FKBP12-rapamycin complex-associated protein
MEESIAYKKFVATASEEEIKVYRDRLLDMWSRRLDGCQRDVNDWLRIFFVRSLIIDSRHRVDTQIRFVALCRQQNRMGLALKSLIRLGINIDKTPTGLSFSFNPHPEMDKSKQFLIQYAFQKYLFASNEKLLALNNLREMQKFVDQTDDVGLKVKVHLKLGKWQLALNERNLTPVRFSPFSLTILYN